MIRDLRKNSATFKKYYDQLDSKGAPFIIIKPGARNRFRRAGISTKKATVPYDNHPEGIPVRRSKNKNRVGKGKPAEGEILFNINRKSPYGQSQEGSLAHEVFHAFDAIKGQLNSDHMDKKEGASSVPKYRTVKHDKGTGIKISDYRAVQFQNTVMTEWNESTGEKQPMRDSYDYGREEESKGAGLDLQAAGIWDYSNGLPFMPIHDDDIDPKRPNAKTWDQQVKYDQ